MRPPSRAPLKPPLVFIHFRRRCSCFASSDGKGWPERPSRGAPRCRCVGGVDAPAAWEEEAGASAGSSK